MKIAFFDTKPYDKETFAPLAKEFGYDITFIEERLTPASASKAKGHDATCSFVNDEVSAQAVQTLKDGGVKVILLRCAGFDSVDLAKAKECGLPVLRVPSYSPESVAEHAIALLQTVNRKTHLGFNNTRKFNFNIDGLMGTMLHGKTAGVVGTGKIGKCAVNILRGFGMKVIAYDAFPDTKSDIEYVTLDELYAKSDVITLHCPLFPATKHMINKESIAKMKDGVILVNSSRGGLINTEELVDAVAAGKFRGVGLDVCEKEHEYFFEDRSDITEKDPTLQKLLAFDNVVLTGHQAFFTEEAMTAIGNVTLNNFKAFLAGEELVNEVK